MSWPRPALALLALPLLLSGCAAGDAMLAQMREPLATYTVVKDWPCRPDRAQLIVDARGATGFGPLTLDSATLERIDTPAPPLRVLAIKAKAFGSWDTAALFADLPPGTYRITALRLTRANAALNLPVPDIAPYTVTLAAGQVHYLGQIVFEERPGLPALRTMDVYPDAQRRGVAFTILKDRFPTSPCLAQLDKAVPPAP